LPYSFFFVSKLIPTPEGNKEILRTVTNGDCGSKFKCDRNLLIK